MYRIIKSTFDYVILWNMETLEAENLSVEQLCSKLRSGIKIDNIRGSGVRLYDDMWEVFDSIYITEYYSVFDNVTRFYDEGELLNKNCVPVYFVTLGYKLKDMRYKSDDLCVYILGDTLHVWWKGEHLECDEIFSLEAVTRYQGSLYLYYTFGGDLMEYNEGYLWKKRVKCSRESFLRSILLH